MLSSPSIPFDASAAIFLFSCWVLVFGHLISWIKMLIFVNFSFGFIIIEWRRIRSFVYSFGHFFGLLYFFLLYYSSKFCHQYRDFLIAEKVRRRYWNGESKTQKKANHSHINTLNSTDWIVYMHRLKIFAEFQTCENCQYLICVDQHKKKHKKIRPQNTMQLIPLDKMNLKKKYTQNHWKHSMFQNPDNKNWFQINDEFKWRRMWIQKREKRKLIPNG